jgi:hypothetical protein
VSVEASGNDGLSHAPEHNDAAPFLLRFHFVCFDTYEGIEAHSFDLLAHCGEAVEAVVGMREVDRRDVRLTSAFASQPSASLMRQQLEARFPCHFLDQHVILLSVNIWPLSPEFQQTITVGGQTQRAYGTACRKPDSSWKEVF